MPVVLDRPINRAAFETYVERVLMPGLIPGDIVGMDSLGSQKGPRSRRAAVGLLFLPPDRPDFTPIGMAFSKREAWLHRGADCFAAAG